MKSPEENSRHLQLHIHVELVTVGPVDCGQSLIRMVCGGLLDQPLLSAICMQFPRILHGLGKGGFLGGVGVYKLRDG